MIWYGMAWRYLCPPEGEDAFLGEHVEGEGVDALLVDHDERLAFLAHFPLEFDHLHHLQGGEGCKTKQKTKTRNNKKQGKLRSRTETRRTTAYILRSMYLVRGQDQNKRKTRATEQRR